MTETTIKQLPDGRWQLLQVYDDWDSLSASVEAMDLDTDWGPDVRVDLTPSVTVDIGGVWQLKTPHAPGEPMTFELSPKPEPWDGVFRVGDSGLTRDGRQYRVKAIDSDVVYCGSAQPIVALVWSDDVPSQSNHFADGRFLGLSDHGRDLMPPTKRGPRP